MLSPGIALTPGRMKRWVPNSNYPDVYVDGLFRQRSGEWVITLFLVNAQQEPKKLRDTVWLFQPELSVSAPDGAPIFRRRRALQNHHADEEEAAMGMLYREQVEFAVGLAWTDPCRSWHPAVDQAVSLKTVIAPAFELCASPRLPAQRSRMQGLVLDMKTLSGLTDSELAKALAPLTAACGLD